MLAEWWLLTDPAPSWRRLIGHLDFYGDTYSPGISDDNASCAAAADFMRHNAEPVQGMLSTFILYSWHVITVYVVTQLVVTTYTFTKYKCGFMDILWVIVLITILNTNYHCQCGLQCCACTHTSNTLERS